MLRWKIFGRSVTKCGRGRASFRERICCARTAADYRRPSDYTVRRGTDNLVANAMRTLFGIRTASGTSLALETNFNRGFDASNERVFRQAATQAFHCG